MQIGGSGDNAVVVDEATLVLQAGANNEVDLGDGTGTAGTGAPWDFETTFLDIFTGGGGGGTVVAINTKVDLGSAQGNNFVIDGGDGGNQFIDLGNNVNLTFSNRYHG